MSFQTRKSFVRLRNTVWDILYEDREACDCAIVTIDDAFHTFMDLDSAIYSAVNPTVTSLPVFIQNFLNCVLKTKKAFTSLEQHFSFWCGVSL